MRLKAALIITLLASSTGFARSVEIKGASQEILKNLKKQNPDIFGKSPTLYQLDLAIKQLFLTGDFENVQLIDRTNDNYLIQAIPVKRVEDILLNGNSQISDSDIKIIMGLEADDRYDRLKFEEGATRLKERYGQLGYLNATIEINFKNAANGNIITEVNITENEICALTSVSFVTNNEELKKSLLKIAKSHVGKPVQTEMINSLTQELQTYLADNRYLVTTLSSPEIQYNPQKTGADATFSIERPFKFVLMFEGNTFFDSSEILKHMSVNASNPTGANPAAELAERIKSLYYSRGFANVDIQFDEQIFTQSFTRRVTFKINEGTRVRIRKIEVLGSLSKPQSYYVDFLEANSSSLISYGYYNREDFEKGMENLIFELQNQGYLKSRIKSSRVDYSKSRDAVSIQVLLDEGPLTIIEAVNFKGNSHFTDEQLRNAINLQPKSPLYLKNLEESLRIIQDFYMNQGYLDMNVLTPNDQLIKYSEDNTRASINYEIHEGPQIRVASISIEGNEKTQNYVIMNELEFKQGDILTPERINDSIYRLQRIGLFSETSITTLEKGTQISERTVMVRVAERNPGLFTSGIGVNTEFDLTLRGYLGVGYRNLGGTARTLTSRIELKRVADVNLIDHKITSGYLEPYLLNSRTRGRVNLTRAYTIKNRDKVNSQVIAAETNELELLLEREFFRHLKVTWNLWSIAYEREFEINDKREESSQIIATIGPSIELDYRDNPFNPTTGTFTRLNSEYSDPALGSTRYIRYTRTNAVFTHYLRLGSPRWVWANSIRGGFVKNLDPGANENRGVPESKIFSLGGRSTIRGFDPQQIPPRSSYSEVDKAFYLNTESSFYLLKSELRFPIYNDFGGVLFYDGGAVDIVGKELMITTNEGRTVPYPKYRDAAGIGFRYNTPVGPVSIEYGFKLNRLREIDENQGRFHLSIGTF